MLSLTLEKIIHWLQLESEQNIVITGNCHAVMITGVSIDSRTLKPNDLFIAIKGEQFDGHDFVEEALNKGAAALIVSQEVKSSLPCIKVPDTLRALANLGKNYRNQYHIPIAAVTGSSGKTTVKEMIASILSTKGPFLANQGNLNTEIGVPLTLLRLLPSHQTAVIEMGARKPGDIAYLMNLVRPSVSVITNAGVAHMGVFGSEKSIAKTKGEIYALLDPNSKAIINLDDPNATYWQGLLKGQESLTFGLDKNAMITAVIKQETELGSVFELKTPFGNTEIKLSTPGRHNICNALAAAATTLAMDLSLANVSEGLKAFLPVKGRLSMKKGPFGSRIIDDTYNANPASVKAAIQVLQAFKGSKIFVMGDMLELGDKAETLHYEMGHEAKQCGIDILLGIGELTKQTVTAFGENARHFLDKPSLIKTLKDELHLINQMEKEGTVLIKGSRGMRMEDIVMSLIEMTGTLKLC